MFMDLLRKYKQKGWFEKYLANHIIYPALEGVKVQVEENDNEYIKGIKYEYESFIANFLKILAYIQSNFEPARCEWIVKEYLACGQNYTNREFLFRYSNVLIMCGLRTLNAGVKQCDIRNMDGITFFRLVFENGIVLQFYAGDVDKGDTENTIRQGNTIELEVGLCPSDIEQLRNRANEEHVGFLWPDTQQIVSELMKGVDLSEGDQIYNICLLHLLSDNINGYNVLSTKGIFLNKYTGLFINDKLHEEYHYEKKVCFKTSGVLAFQYSLSFFVYGDIRYLTDENHSFFAVNKLGCNYRHRLNPFVQSDITDKVMGIYNPTSQDIVERYNFYIAFMLENYKNSLSSVFTNKEVILIKGFILKNLHETPQLLRAFNMDYEEAKEEIFKRYEQMYIVIKRKYPSNHPFQRKEFLFDAMAFSLAYCLFVVPTYLNNSDMIEDFLQKKLVCKQDGLFNSKLFNESYSEFEIFFYLFVGVFCNSERYKDFLQLEYEPSGNKNKRFEYAFIFCNYIINIEVKALECAPEDTDNINLVKMENSTRFYKNYFHAYDENEVIPEEILQNAMRLKSNYRQVSKNIKKIKEKCTDGDGVINLGFLMINYGTSREEYISYLLNREQGYLRKNPLDKLDAIILFSMCLDTDLLMEKVLEKEHIFVFANAQKDNDALLTDLRLNNYICEGDDNPYQDFFDDVYGVYTGINAGGIVTIQRDNISETELKRAQNIICDTNRNMHKLIELSK